MIDSHATERALGARIVELLEARGDSVRVAFADSDFVVAVELVGDLAGGALLPRALRSRHPFVRVG